MNYNNQNVNAFCVTSVSADLSLEKVKAFHQTSRKKKQYNVEGMFSYYAGCLYSPFLS